MPPELKKEQYTKAEVQELIRVNTEELSEKVEVATLLAEMTDAHKAYYKSLTDDAGKQDFLFKDASERDLIVSQAQSADPVVYKSADGTEYRKSAGEQLINLAKKADQDRLQLEKLHKDNEQHRLEKLAETEYKYLPGTLETRVELLKSVERISDETARKASLDALKAQNAEMAKAFETLGTHEGKTIEKGAATTELDGLAKKYHQEHPDISYVDAYDLVSKANPEIYAKAVAGE